MKDRIKAVFDVMQKIETHGESTMMMAECLREMARIVADMSKENEVTHD